MPYFSRLTDIVTCNLTSVLREADDPRQVLDDIIREMREGVAGAQRSAATAARNLEKVETEIAEQESQVGSWLEQAKKSLAAKDDHQARQSLMRKKEVEALIAGLQQQRESAVATRDHLQTTLNALRARLTDAERRLQGFPADKDASVVSKQPPATPAADEWAEVDQELAALRKELGQG